MSRSLYYCHSKTTNISPFWGVKPYSNKWADYHELDRRINLKHDLRWHEVKHLQAIIAKSDLWENFPAAGLTLVGAEFKSGDEPQRVDLLYLREDGGLLPCELKIGGTSKDTHGQLIRYIADITFQTINTEYIEGCRKSVEKWGDSLDLNENKYRKFIVDNRIQDKFLRLLPKAGIIMDEGFPKQLLKAVRYLNQDCGFSIRLLEIRAFVDQGWESPENEFLMRIDFVDIQ